MTAPKIVRPGDIVFTSARTVQRTFLLRPDKDLTTAVEYLLAHYSAVYGIELYAACLMSTHLHLVYRDVEAEGPNFLRDLHRGVALVVQRIHGWSGAVFSQRPCQVRIHHEAALIDKIGYVLANPVARNGVVAPEAWPGLWSGLKFEEKSARRPDRGFSPRGRLPPASGLRFVLPDVLVSSRGRTGALRALRSAYERHQRLNRARVRQEGGRFLAPQACRRINPRAQSSAAEPKGSMTPQFATLGSGREGYLRAVRELREFRRAYREALEHFRKGLRDVLFPAGTFLMRSVLAVNCSSA